jgi:hypothetical protein
MLRKLAIWITDRKDALRRRFYCGYCRNERKLLSYGRGKYADLIACPLCRDGKKLADTLFPTVVEADHAA